MNRMNGRILPDRRQRIHTHSYPVARRSPEQYTYVHSSTSPTNHLPTQLGPVKMTATSRLSCHASPSPINRSPSPLLRNHPTDPRSRICTPVSPPPKHSIISVVGPRPSRLFACTHSLIQTNKHPSSVPCRPMFP